jgi:hypothetical protein
MGNTGNYSIEEANRFFAVYFNNEVWRLLGSDSQSEDDKREIIHLAHASLAHWRRRKDCKIKNLSRGEYLIAIAYINAGRKEPAMHHAGSCLEITQSHPAEMDDFDLAHAHLIMGWASHLNGNSREAGNYFSEAKRLGEGIKNVKDKEIFLSDLKMMTK